MKVEILTIGNELLLGFTVDSNSAFLSRELAALGVEVVRHTSVADTREAIAAEVNAALGRTGAVITSGGLGPTSDDLSVESVAAALGRDLVEDASVLQWMEELFSARGYKLPLSPTNRRQAMVPRGATPLRNRRGTAPGIWIDVVGRGWVVMLPGVPRELMGLFSEEVAPVLLSLQREPTVVMSRTVRTTGIAEAALADVVQKAGFEFAELAYLPGLEGVDLRITVRGLQREAAQHALLEQAARLTAVVGETAYGEDDADLAEVVLRMARDRRMRISVAESCTGGLLGARISAIPGASDVFVGGTIAYANEVKSALLDVPGDTLDTVGAVSEETVRAMCAGACTRFGTEIGMAVSGVAGPGGGTVEKPVGTVWICVQVSGAARAVMRVLPGNRTEIRERAAQMALDLARLELSRR